MNLVGHVNKYCKARRASQKISIQFHILVNYLTLLFINFIYVWEKQIFQNHKYDDVFTLTIMQPCASGVKRVR